MITRNPDAVSARIQGEFDQVNFRLNQAKLQKAAVNAATLTQGQPVASSDFNVLILQDLSLTIQNTMLNEGERCSLVANLPKDTATQVKKERDLIHSYGNLHLPSAMPETGLPAESNADLSKIVSDIRYYTDLRTITHVAQNVDILTGFHPDGRAPSKGGLQFERTVALKSLAEKIEVDYWHGNSAFNPNGGDSFFRQVQVGGVAGVNYVDLRGAQLSFDRIIDALGEVNELGFEGKPSKLFIPPKVWKSLSKEAATKNRLDPARKGDVFWNPDANQLLMFGPTGTPLELVSSYFINPLPYDFYKSAGIAGVDYDSLAAVQITATAAPSADSQFIAADAGTYSYMVAAIYQSGLSNAVQINPIAVTAGDAVSFSIADTGKLGTLYGYRVWRSAKNTTSGYAHIGDFARVPAGTTFKDANAVIAGTSRLAAMHLMDGAVTDDVLLGAYEEPLANVNRVNRMIYGSYRALSVNQPKRHVAFINVGV